MSFKNTQNKENHPNDLSFVINNKKELLLMELFISTLFVLGFLLFIIFMDNKVLSVISTALMVLSSMINLALDIAIYKKIDKGDSIIKFKDMFTISDIPFPKFLSLAVITLMGVIVGYGLFVVTGIFVQIAFTNLGLILYNGQHRRVVDILAIAFRDNMKVFSKRVKNIIKSYGFSLLLTFVLIIATLYVGTLPGSEITETGVVLVREVPIFITLPYILLFVITVLTIIWGRVKNRYTNINSYKKRVDI